jgi:hypothetical protein
MHLALASFHDPCAGCLGAGRHQEDLTRAKSIDSFGFDGTRQTAQHNRLPPTNGQRRGWIVLLLCAAAPASFFASGASIDAGRIARRNLVKSSC